MTLLREYTAALSALLGGETVTTHGRYVRLDDVTLEWPRRWRRRCSSAGSDPRTVWLAGELGDGVVHPRRGAARTRCARRSATLDGAGPLMAGPTSSVLRQRSG